MGRKPWGLPVDESVIGRAAGHLSPPRRTAGGSGKSLNRHGPDQEKKMKLTRRLSLVAAAAALACAGQAAAQTSPQTANLVVSATVTANCIVSTTPLNFGNYNPLSATTVQGTGTLVLRCTRGSVPSVTLDNGTQFSGGSRRMTVGGEFLNYSLLRPVANTPGAACPALGAGTAWNATAFVLAAATNSASRTFNICGELPGSQDVTAGVYQDTVVANVTF